MFSDRIKDYIAFRRVSIRAFEIHCGLKNGTLSRAIKKNTTLNGENIAIIGKSCPDLNLDWLLTGRGEMLISENTLKGETINRNAAEEIERLRKELQEWKDVVQILKRAVLGKEKNEE